MQKFTKFYPFLIIIGVVMIVFAPYLLGYIGTTLNVGTNDNLDLQIPFRQVLQESIRAGRLPLWEPRISAGFPLFAEGQTGALYPPNLIVALLPVPAYYSVTLSIICAIIISSIGMYLFLSEFLSNRLELEQRRRIKMFALFGAVIWSQAGVNFNHTAHLNVLNIFAWLPFELWLIERRINNNDSLVKTVIVLSLTIALQVLAGHPQFASYCLMFISLYWLCNQALIKGESVIKNFFVNGLAIGAAILLGLALGAVQLLPTLEFTANSTRQTGLDEEAINFLSLRIQDVPTFVAPFYNFTYEPRSMAQLAQIGWPFDERYSYIGIIPLILAGVSLAFIPKKRQAIVLTVLGTFFLLLSLGNQSPIGILLKFPPLNLFRIPVKFTPLAQFSFITLATYGLWMLFNQTLMKKSKEYPFRKIFWIIVIIMVISVTDTGSKLYKLYPIQKADWWFEKPSTVDLYEGEIIKNGISKPNKPLDAQVLGQDYNVQMHRQYLEQDPKLWDEMQPQVFKNNRAILPAFDMLSYDVPLLDNAINSAGLKVKWYSDLESQMFFFNPQLEGNLVNYPDHYWKIVRLVGAKYFLHNDNLESENADLIGKTNFTTGQDQVGLYKIKNPLPYIQAAPEIRYVNDSDTLKSINDDNFNPENQIIVSNDSKLQSKILTNSKISDIRYTANTPQSISILLTTSGPGIVLVRQSYFPGWIAVINNSPTKIIRVNHALQGIYIPNAGQQKIQLIYKPNSVTNGLYVSGSALFVWMLCMIYDSYMTSRRPKLDSSRSNTQPI